MRLLNCSTQLVAANTKVTKSMAPYELDNVVGHRLLVDLNEDDALAREHIGEAVSAVTAGS